MVLFWIAGRTALDVGSKEMFIGILGMLLALGMLFLNWRWCTAGGVRIERLWADVHSELRRRGVRLDHRPQLSRPRIERTARRFLLFALVGYLVPGLIVVATSYEGGGKTPVWPIVLVAMLLLIGGLLVVILFRGSRQVGFEPRLRATSPGLAGLLAVLFILAGQLPSRIATSLPSDSWEVVFAVRDIVNRAPASDSVITFPSGKTAPASEVHRALSIVETMAAVGLGIVPLCWGIAAICFLPTLRSLDVVIRHGERMAGSLDLATSRSAASGEGFLGRFRFLLVFLWIAATILVLLGIASLIEVGYYAAFEAPVGWTSGGRDVAGAAAHAAKLTLDLPVDSLIAEVATRWVWSSWALIAILALSGSVGNWLVTRRRVRADLQRAYRETASTTASVRLAELVAKLTRTARIAPLLCVIDDSTPTAASYEFGLVGRQRFIAVTSRSLQVLADEELQALLAHELAHLEAGHCRNHRLLQILGRLTFVGDAFVGALEHSFGYELDADRLAVVNFGVDSAALRRCLLKVQAIMMAEQISRSLLTQGLAAVSTIEPRLEVDRRGLPTRQRGRLSEAARLWLRLFSGQLQISYWHPVIEERIRQLDSMSPVPRGGSQACAP